MQTFLEYYQQEIRPRIMAIDTFLKSEPQPYAVEQVAHLFHLSATELGQLLDQEKFMIITRGVFLHLMQLAPAPFCRMFGREISCGMPTVYSPDDISYIYGIEIGLVQGAATKLGRKYFSATELMDLFGEIMIPEK